ncbi:hypothetical protein CY35_03G078700 [Sphagnum magellanicum]|nr:hypothetical protein CY35_03G078700 [Sphagnum magellanicum]
MEMMAAASALQAHHPPPCFFPPVSSCHNNTRVCGRVLGLGSTPRLLRLRIKTRTTRIRILYVRAAANKDSSLGEDYVSRLLRERPSQVEPKYLIGDELYTLREKQRLETPLWKRAVETVQNQFAKVGSETPSQPEDEIPVPSKGSDANERDKQVYLSDLLREYRGNLYVPEEAFSGHVSELEEFNRLLDVLPEMTFESFLKAMNAQQVEMLTSRGHASPRGEFVYYDFIVDLKSIPGEQHLQRRHWAMHLTEPEAQTVLSKYTGPQHEVETYFTPYVEPPPATPHPAASSISGRVVLELSVVASLVGAAAFAVGGMASVLLFTLTGTLSVLLLRVLWPLAAPLVNPVLGLVLDIARATGNVILGVLSGGAVGSKGLPALFSDGYRYLTSGALFSSARTLGAIIFVLVAMAALAKFTLTRRPKDFTKWDLWQAIEFGQSKPQARVEGTTGVGFADVAGIDDVVTELQELVSYLKDPERFNQMGTKPPHGVLLEGPPGCGKTLLAKAIAGEAGVPFYQMAGSEFVEVLVGVGAARIRDLFKRAKVNRPSVVFIDEIDALGAMRHGAAGEEGMDSYNAGAQERETTLNQLLIELDGFDTGKGVVFLGATNRMDMLDPALLRPGRFDRKIAIRPPRAKGRYEILKVHSKSVKLDDSVDLESYAKNLPGWSGAELAQLLQEAALVAVRHGGTVINRLDMDRALDRLTMGSERIGLQRRLPVHRRMATHETGLALTSHLLRRLEDAETEFCDRVSIVPRGETLARTIFDRLDDEAYLFERLPALLHRLQVMLGGRAAEEVMYGRDTSTFSLLHLPDASWLARKLVSV